MTLLILVLWRIIGQDNYMKKIIYIVIVIVLGSTPGSLFAADFFFETNHSMYGTEDEVFIDVFLDTEDIVNTISGSVVIENSSNVSIDIIDGNSSILFWVEKPYVENNTVSFSGITPGGIQGNSLFLFSLAISGQHTGDVLKLHVENGTILLHDGEGTKETVTSLPKNIYISEDESFSNITEMPIDKEQPEDFTPTIVQDSNLYDGKNVLVFLTQDKASGISSYEIKEGYFGRYIKAESPYLLKDQKLFKTIFVKAVDDAGNERIAIVHPQEKVFDENFILIFSILIVAVTIIFIIYRKKYR